MTKYESGKIEAVLTTLYESGTISKQAFKEIIAAIEKSKPKKVGV